MWHMLRFCKAHARACKHRAQNTHPPALVVALPADRWCVLKEIQAYPAQTGPGRLSTSARSHRSASAGAGAIRAMRHQAGRVEAGG